MGVAMLAAALGLGADATAWDVQLRSEVRQTASTSQPAPTAAFTTFQLEPTVSASTGWADLRGLVFYAPRFLADSAENGQAQLLHRGRARLDWLLDRTRKLSFEEDLQAGRMDFSPLTGALPAGTVLDPRLAAVRSVPYVSTVSSVGYEERLSRTARASVTASFILSGSTDAMAQRDILPLQKGLRIEAQAGYLATPLDDLSARFDGSRVDFSTGSRTFLTSLGATWRRRISTGSDLAVGAGSSFSSVFAPGRGFSSSARPAGSISWRHVLTLRGSSIAGTASAAVSPTIDVVGGTVVQRANGRFALEVAPTGPVRVTASAEGARDLGRGGTGLVSGEFGASLALNPRVAVAGGVRGSWSSNAAVGSGQAIFQGAGFLFVTLNERGVF